MKIIYNLVGESGIFASAPPTLLTDKESIDIKFIGAPQNATAVVKLNNTSSYIEIKDGSVNIPRDLFSKNPGQGLFSMLVSVITSTRPLRRWDCESIGFVRLGDKILVFPNYEETRKKLSELSAHTAVLAEKVATIEKKMKSVDEKVSKFVGGDITE